MSIQARSDRSYAARRSHSSLRRGRARVVVLCAVVAAAATGPSRAAPLLGQHNDDVLGSVLGVSEAEIAQLRDDGIL